MGTRAHHAVARHPVHFSVVLFVQPRLQFGFGLAQVSIGNTDLLKAQFQPPLLNILR